MFKYLSPFLVILSCGMHIFCCGIPLFLSISSLGAMLGISGAAFEIEWFEAIEDKVFIISGLVLLFSIFTQSFFNQDDYCDDETCTIGDHNAFQKNLTRLAVILYLINIVIFFSS